MIAKIIQYTDKQIRNKSIEVKEIDDSVHQLIADMIETSKDWEKSRVGEEAVAMAAIQINDPRRVTIVRDVSSEDGRFIAMINPRISITTTQTVDDYEGCLSVEGVYSILPRAKEIVVSFTDERGKEQKMRVRGFMARIIQHEVAHMDGSLFIDYIDEESKVFTNFHTEELIPADSKFVKELIESRNKHNDISS